MDDPGLSQRHHDLTQEHIQRVDEFRRSKDTSVLVVMFTDLKGSTEIAERRGERYAQGMRRIHDEMLLETIERDEHGLFVKNIGDAILSIFSEPSVAVERALEIQRKLHQHNREHPDEEPILVRIGMHMGQVAVEDQMQFDVFGRHVNRAARMEALADPGQILLTHGVYDSAKGWIDQDGVGWADHGSYLLKGIAEPVGVYEVVNTSIGSPRAPAGRRHVGTWERRLKLGVIALGLALVAVVGVHLWRSRSTETGIISVALLPLESLRPDAEQEWFTYGVTESLTTDLAKITGLRVIPRSSVARYRGTDKAPTEIAEELGVAYLIEGSVVKIGDRVRISARLIDAPGNEYLWAQDYERDFKDILTLQGEVARAIAGQVRVELTPQEETKLASSREVDPEAYELYLKGRHHASRGTRVDTERAVEYYNQALARDPDFGPAYTGLVESYLLQGFSTLPPEEASRRFLECSQKAIELDDALGADHHQLAMIRLFGHWDWAGAEAELERAIELDPGSSSAYDSYCQFLWAMGRTEESVAAGERAVELDPLCHFANCDLAWAYYFHGQMNEAIDQVRKTVELFGSECRYHSDLEIRLMVEQVGTGVGTYENVVTELKRRRETAAAENDYIGGLLGYVYALSGRTGQAREILHELRERGTRESADPWYLASIHAALGEKDEALRLLEGAYERRSFIILYTIKVSRWLDPLRDDPRFEDLLDRMNLAGPDV